MNFCKNLLKRLFFGLGYEIRKYRPEDSKLARFIKALSSNKIDVIFDIGANEGQFASEIRNAGYGGLIVSFEPASHAHEILCRRSRGDDNWIVHKRVAIGEKTGILEMNLSKNSVSSSLLPMLNSHLKAAPLSQYIDTEMVEVETIDNIAWQYLNTGLNVFIKIDTQGYEDKVLEGAKEILKKSKGIQVELSGEELYQGSALWIDIVHKLYSQNFKLWGMESAFVDYNSGKTLQWDGLFFKTCQ